MDDKSSEYFNNNGKEINPDLISRPSLCITCRKNSLSGEEEILCNLTRADQQGEEDFICEAYEPRDIETED